MKIWGNLLFEQRRDVPGDQFQRKPNLVFGFAIDRLEQVLRVLIIRRDDVFEPRRFAQMDDGALVRKLPKPFDPVVSAHAAFTNAPEAEFMLNVGPQPR